MELFRNASLYGPEPLGRGDILIEGGRITAIGPNLPDGGLAKVYDLEGRTVSPGYVDNHVHLTGGGGEGGPATRTPEARIEELVSCGVTTVVGLLGTDSVTRSLENLLAKTRALCDQGLTAYCLTGGYAYPPETLCGSVERDIVLIDRVLGVKTALSDHRSSQIGSRELIWLASQARRAGMMAGCAGIVTIHVGAGKAMLEPLLRAVRDSEIPASQWLPTHLGRSDQLFSQGLEFVKLGGTMDVTAGSTREENEDLARKILRYLDGEPTADHLSVSSDAYGSQPRFGKNMEYLGLDYATGTGLNDLLRTLLAMGVPPQLALKPLTSTPARVLGLRRKGSLAPGMDADFVVYDEGWQIEGVVAGGQVAMWDKKGFLRDPFSKATV